MTETWVPSLGGFTDRAGACGEPTSSSSSAFPSYISGVHHFWVRFLRMRPFFFFNPTIKVVTFRLRGWCVLGVFLLPAFTRL